MEGLGLCCSDNPFRSGTFVVARDAVVTFTAAMTPTPIRQMSASQTVLII